MTRLIGGLIVALLLTGSTQAQNAPPPSVFNVDSLSGLILAIKASTVMNTGYGWSMEGDRGVLFAQQLTLVKGQFAHAELNIGPSFATHFTEQHGSRELLGPSVSFKLFKTPPAVANALEVTKPVTLNFNEVYGFIYAGTPVTDIGQMQFSSSHTVFGGGLGISF